MANNSNSKNTSFLDGPIYDIDAQSSAVCYDNDLDIGSIISDNSQYDVYYKGTSIGDIINNTDVQHNNAVNYILYLEHKINILEKIIMSVASEKEVCDYKNQIDQLSKILTEIVKNNE